MGGGECPAGEGTPGPPSPSRHTLGFALGHVVLAAALVVRAELVALTLPVRVEALSAAVFAGLCGGGRVSWHGQAQTTLAHPSLAPKATGTLFLAPWSARTAHASRASSSKGLREAIAGP